MPHHKSHKYGICSKLKKNLLMHANKSKKKRVLTFCEVVGANHWGRKTERGGDGMTTTATVTEREGMRDWAWRRRRRWSKKVRVRVRETEIERRVREWERDREWEGMRVSHWTLFTSLETEFIKLDFWSTWTPTDHLSCWQNR